MKHFWNVVYVIYPKFLRLLEKTGMHSTRQDFLIGSFNAELKVSDLETHLISQEYHLGVLSWKDPGEILNLRKLDGKLYQYHIRVFDDGEVRAHYEYSSESRPLQHVLESHFEPRHEYFQELLGEYLIPVVR
jgi:hypothetical protein